MEEERRCRYCDRVMRKSITSTAKYCSDSCKVMACRQRTKNRARVVSACRSIEQCAPQGAAYYRLGLRGGRFGPLQFYGPFSVDPLEPPMVPEMGIYQINYFDSSGRDLGTPDTLEMGIFIRTAVLKAAR